MRFWLLPDIIPSSHLKRSSRIWFCIWNLFFLRSLNVEMRCRSPRFSLNSCYWRQCLAISIPSCISLASTGAVAQLVARSAPVPKVLGLNPAFSTTHMTCLFSASWRFEWSKNFLFPWLQGTPALVESLAGFLLIHSDCQSIFFCTPIRQCVLLWAHVVCLEFGWSPLQGLLIHFRVSFLLPEFWNV